MGDKETPEGRNIKSKKKLVRFGDKAFKIQQVDMSEIGEDELYQSDAEMDANLYMAFQGKKKPYQPKNEKGGKYEKHTQKKHLAASRSIFWVKNGLMHK